MLLRASAALSMRGISIAFARARVHYRAGQRWSLRADDLLHLGEARLAHLEWLAAGEQFVEQDAQQIDVGCRRDELALHLFRDSRARA